MRTLRQLAIFSGILLAHGFSSVDARAYTNPIEPPSEIASDGIGDPFVLKYNGTFYLYASNGGTLGFRYWTSTDLVNWSYGGVYCTDTLSLDGYAPEVVYWNGTFYMYTSPGGGGHYVFTSDSPGGPFVRATTNLGHSIDGDVFIDDDATWYFFNAAGDGIHGSLMKTATSLGAETVLNGSQIAGQWTEGPTVFKRNGIYYLTDTGNHVISPGYRVNVASSSAGPLGPYTPSNINPILLSSEGPHAGLGHNSVLIGPDLDTYYIVYHTLDGISATGAGKFPRHLNVDAIGWNGDKLVPYGPSYWPMQTPAGPDFEDRFQRASLGGGYAGTGGTWGIAGGFLTQSAVGNAAPVIEYAATFSSAADYTAEYNVQETSSGTTAPRAGAVFGYVDAQNYGYAVLNGATHQLQTNLSIGGVWGSEVSTALPAGFDSQKLHTIRIEKAGKTYKIFVDKRLMETKTGAGLGAGHVGYLSQDDSAKFGYLAVSNNVNGTGIFDFYKPIPGTIQAVHYATGGEGVGYHDTTDGNTGGKYLRGDNVDIRDNPEGGHNIGWNTTGEWYKYHVSVQAAGVYDVGVRYATTFDSSRVRIWLDAADVTGIISLPSTLGFDNWQTYTIKGVQLAAGNHTLEFETVAGEFDFYQLKVDAADGAAIDVLDTFASSFGSGWNFSGGNWSIVNGAANITDTGKRTLGNTGWADYTVECDVTGNNGLNSGLIVRVQNPAQGGAGDDANLGTDFYQGYFVGLSTTGLGLGKQNYDWQPLASSPGTYPLQTAIHLKVVVRGNNIKVFAAGATVPQIDYTDNAAPFINGKVGLRSHHANASFDNFKVSAEATPAIEITGGGGTSAGGASAGGASAGGASAGGPSTAGAAGNLATAGAAGNSAGGGSGGRSPALASPSNGSSCGCRMVGDASSKASSWQLGLLSLAALTLRLRGRRRRRRPIARSALSASTC